MGDEFSIGIRARKQKIAITAQRGVKSADTKPEAIIRYHGDDEPLNRTLDVMRRTLETVGGQRGNRADQGVTYRGLEAALQEYFDVLENGSTGLGTTRVTADQAVLDAQAAAAAAAQAAQDAQDAADAAADAIAYAAEAHTGEITSAVGSHSMQLDVTSITNQTNVVAEAADDIAIHDASDGTIKKINLSSITDGGSF